MAMLASCSQVATTPSDTAALSAEVTRLKEQVAYFSDREQIHHVYLHYIRGFDRNDVELMRSASGLTCRLIMDFSQIPSKSSSSDT
jgi:hypothetical protein